MAIADERKHNGAGIPRHWSIDATQGAEVFELAGVVALTSGYIEMVELADDPAAPAADGGRLYLKDSGAGKTQLCIRFNTGAVQVIATQP